MKRNRSETREGKELETSRKRPRTSGRKPLQWLRGRLCPKRNEKFWFIKPLTELPEGYNRSKDVFLRANYIPQFVLPVVEGDVLEFTLGDRDKTKPMAIKVRVSQYSQRTCEELIEYMRKLTQDLNSVHFKKVIVQVLPCTALWSFLGSPAFKGVSDAEVTHVTYVEVFLSLLKQVLHNRKSYKNLLEEVIKTVTLGTIFQDTNNRSLSAIITSCSYTNDRFCVEGHEKFLSAELVRSFCHEAIRQVPSVTRCLLSTVNAIRKKIESPSTQSFLFDLLSLNATGENSSVVNAMTWKELSLIPTDQELAGHLVEKDQHLTPVRTNVPYDNPEQYMDTYFRLVRAETFSAIQHGIKDLKASKLDLRDMNVYYNIYLAGLQLHGARFSLAIHFTPVKNVKKWETSPQLMYGNLVCLSVNQRFDDVIWATVSRRDAGLLNKRQIIMLELLDENVKSMSAIIYSLQTRAGSAVMVESPTYYHSLSPILRSIKEFDMENFPLQKEIIYAKPTLQLPGYLKDATLYIDVEISYSKTRSTTKRNHKDKPEDEKDSERTLEETKREDQKKFDVLESIHLETLTANAISLDVDMEEQNSEPVIKRTLEETPSIATSELQSKLPNDGPQERMDVEHLPENNFHSIPTLEGQRSKYIKYIYTLLANSSTASISRKPRNTRLRRLRRRLSNFERSKREGKKHCDALHAQSLGSDDSMGTLTANAISLDLEMEEKNSEPVMKITLEETPSIATSELQCQLSNDGPEERTDVEHLPENNLHSIPTLIVQRSEGMKESRTIYSPLANPSTASTSRTPQNTTKVVRLKRPVKVEHYLQILKSTSGPSLEASQREALIYALKNRLALIQGPPGCGKTYIGVKIVQLLLSLTPKLEKPILLMTYKNHALDEFLKHTLRFCQKDDIVRIGGRSKEPELESCNLKVIQNSISYDKKTLIEIQNMSGEISDVESRIKKISAEVATSCYLTKESLVAKLTEDQIKSLMVEAGWGRGSMIYPLNRRCFADKSLIKRWLNDISRNVGSIKKFIQTSLQSGVSENDSHGRHCMKVFEIAFEKWCPDRRELQRTKELQAEFILQMQKSTIADEDTSKAADDGDDDDEDEDEDYIKQLLEFRMASGARQVGCSTNDGLTLFNPASRTNEKNILVEISDYPPDMALNSQILFVSNLWSLTKAQRLKFFYCILNETATRVSQELNELLELLQSLKNRKQELELNDKVELLSKKKIIGVTITGASINHDLLHRIGPSVVIVEEAAEILEPSLLAALTPSIEHLILIGDHKQLRPQVDTYDLCRDFQFDVSMMERLIDSEFPYKSLARQNRMRPEFSALLHDIYPNLHDNLPLVSKNKPLKCIAKSMFFWSHDDPEKEDRTFTNVKEAERVIALVLYLLSHRCHPSEITVLAAYLGQTKLLRKMIKAEQTKHPEVFQEDFVQVQTIDMYQGDENNYVIVSLVRSNRENRIGFLKSWNRRCVAQSRAKCGMFFVGNVNTLREAKGSCWLNFITSMMEQDCVANQIPLQCTKHEASKFQAVDGDSIRKVITNRRLLCRKPCGDPCSQDEKHPCKMPCFKKHEHGDCTEKVTYKFPDCGHAIQRKCHEKICYLRCEYKTTVELPCGHEGKKKCCEELSDVVCRIPVTAAFPRCGHQTEKECHVKIETMSCKHPCEEMNSCGKHPCKNICGEPHGHGRCRQLVHYKFPKCGHPSSRRKPCSQEVTWNCEYKVYFTGACGHEIKKKCCEEVSDVVCRISVTATFPRCGHQTEKECYVKIDRMSCKHPCEEMNSCGQHPCRNVCGNSHGHDRCPQMIYYSFPKCGHPSSDQKTCSEEITWSCEYKVYFTGACGHVIEKKCHQLENEVKCKVTPCERTRKCGHPCANPCGDVCEKGECKHCQRVYQKKMEEFRAAAKKRYYELEEKIKKKEIPVFSRHEIRDSESSAAEYKKVKDQVEKFIKPCHKWFPTITKIEKVTNLVLEKRFERAKSRTFGDNVDRKFHGTSNNNIYKIVKKGFKMPEANPRPPKKRGMFGQGIYFATDSSKSAQEVYTKVSPKLLLCEVILGRSITVDKADDSLNKDWLFSKGYDSVYAPGGTAVKSDEFVIFNPDQALPKYIIHFSGSNTVVPPSPSTLIQQEFFVKTMLPSRTVNFQDPFEMYYSFAESHFRRMAAKSNPPLSSQQATISSIDIVINKDLEQKFEATKQTFKSQGIPDREVLAYHGTDKKNIDSILKSNLQLSYAKRQLHGKGNYFSEFPAVSLGYGNGLLLCRILPGKEFVDSTSCDIPPDYNSKKVLRSQAAGATTANASGEMIIIENSDQIFPFFVIHR